MENPNINVGDVFYYNSQFLNTSTEPHYHIVVANNIVGIDGREDKIGVVIVTSYRHDNEPVFRKRGGNNSYVIADTSDYTELSHKSIINCYVREEDIFFIKDAKRKKSISNDLLEKIKEAIKKNKRNSPRITNLFE